MRLRKNWMRLAAAAAATALLATACGGGDDGGDGGDEGNAQATAGGELRANLTEPEHLIPYNTNESEGGTIMDVVYSQMVEHDPEGDLLLTIANSIETDDGVHWSITLKEGWEFHNGEPVNADAFIRGWNYGAYGPNAQGNSYFFDRIVGYDEMQYQPEELDAEGAPKKDAQDPEATELAGLEKTGEYSFDVTLKEPFVSFDMMLGYTAFAPMAQECLDDLEACEQSPIGNGPFQMDGEWVHNEQIRVTRFEDYQGEKPKLDAITFRIFADQETAYNEIQGGGLDLIRTVPPERRSEARSFFTEERFIEEPTSSFTYLGFPLYDERFEDKRLRQAFSLAIDRQAIIDAVLDGAFVPAKSFISPVVPGSREDACDYCEQDIPRAKQLLDEAGGWPEGEKLKIRFNPGAGHDAWTEAVGNQLRENLGIDYQLDSSLEWAQYLETLDAEQSDGMFRLGWIMDYPSPENYLKPVYGSQGSSNNAGYANPEFDQLLASGDSAADLDAAIADYQAAEDLLLEDLPVMPMWYGRSSTGWNDNVDNVTYNLIDTNPYWSQITIE